MWSYDGAKEVVPQLRNKPRSRFEAAAKSVHKCNVLVDVIVAKPLTLHPSLKKSNHLLITPKTKKW